MTNRSDIWELLLQYFSGITITSALSEVPTRCLAGVYRACVLCRKPCENTRRILMCCREEDVCLCDSCCECAVGAFRASCWRASSERRSPLAGGLRPGLTVVFSPGAFLPSIWISLSKSTWVWGRQGAFVCRRYSEKHSVQKEECHIGPQKTGRLPEFWFQHPVFNQIAT